jgi:hypothetical protein
MFKVLQPLQLQVATLATLGKFAGRLNPCDQFRCHLGLFSGCESNSFRDLLSAVESSSEAELHPKGFPYGLKRASLRK